MPLGVSWTHYLCYTFTCFTCVAIGSQLVHSIYKPLNDLDKYLEHEMKKYPPDVQEKIRKKLIENNIIQ